MTTYLVQKGDYVSKIATNLTGDPRRWPELCAANPQLKRDAKAGCVVFAGRTINLPASWNGPAARLPAPIALTTGTRPDAELVYVPPASAASSAPAIVDLDSSTAAIIGAPTSSVVSKVTSPTSRAWIKWTMIGGSVVVVGGVLAWWMLRTPSPSSTSPRPNFSDWLRHKIGTKEPDKKPSREPRRNRKSKSSKSSKPSKRAKTSQPSERGEK